MILAILAAASILGDRPLSAADPHRQALSVLSEGRVVVRLEANGLVQARGCDGQLRAVGVLTDPRKIHIGNDGALAGLAYQADLTEHQRIAFQQIMRAFGYSDWRGVERPCVPVEGAGTLLQARGPGARGDAR